MFNLPHMYKGGEQRGSLAFKLELATDLIGIFSSRKRSGRPSSSTQHEQHERLHPCIGHWSQHVLNKSDCVVCAAAIMKQTFAKGRQQT